MTASLQKFDFDIESRVTLGNDDIVSVAVVAHETSLEDEKALVQDIIGARTKELSILRHKLEAAWAAVLKKAAAPLVRKTKVAIAKLNLADEDSKCKITAGQEIKDD